ncbi:unnamed protein product [Gemmata massiliana]|uniref:Uncharacterized protein n=1 Tax=Gemmata massiliana TaxID=1210884 RepID=A0A6P2CZ15_9BACT|nr:hypothetical protein [Gemmata massiliana]VTR94103.1 unnamed protein product [Gemmata massiliana]
MKTLPELVREWGASLDVTRKLIRRTPALQQLGQTFGAVRLYREDEGLKIRTALDARAKKKTASVG